MDGLIVALFVPTVLFLCIVAPIWIFMHYRSKQHAQSALTRKERDELEDLLQKTEGMTERIETLEAILDAQTPDWRRRMEGVQQ